jgi:ATP-dependent RNA helicase HrpB
VLRLWDERDRLRPHRQPEIHRVDLSAAALDVIAWGGDPRTFEWFDPPSSDGLNAALSLLERLGLVAGRTLTALGEQARYLPLHPRLARMVMTAGGSRNVARACALLSERHLLPAHAATTTSDVLSALDRWSELPHHVHRAAEQILAAASERTSSDTGESAFRRAILAGYPDRVARRRDVGSTRFLLATGSGAVQARESGVRDAEFIVALDVQLSGTPGPRRLQPSADEPVIRMASRVELEWLTPTSSVVEHRFDAISGRVKAARVDRYDALVLGEHPIATDLSVAAPILAAAWLERGPGERDRPLLRRLAFAGIDVDLQELALMAASGARTIDDVDIAGALPPKMARDLERDAPSRFAAPSGRSHPVEYGEDGSVSVEIKLQELFGLTETPRIGKRRIALRISLLAPNGRPVQVTQDLRSFWERTYPEVRKELRGRYPKHSWPEDPWTASPKGKK